MRKVFLDKTTITECVSVYMKDAEVNWAGATVYSMSVKHKNKEYQRFADEYDIHFIFDDNIPVLDFYTIPLIDIFATDSDGGYLGSVGEGIDLEGNVPICYIDKERNCYLIASDSKGFFNNVVNWKKNMTLYKNVEFFSANTEAMKKYEFISIDDCIGK